MGKRNRRMRKLKKKKKKQRRTGRKAPLPSSSNAIPIIPKAPMGRGRERRGFLHQALKASEMTLPAVLT